MKVIEAGGRRGWKDIEDTFHILPSLAEGWLSWAEVNSEPWTSMTFIKLLALGFHFYLFFFFKQNLIFFGVNVLHEAT